MTVLLAKEIHESLTNFINRPHNTILHLEKEEFTSTAALRKAQRGAGKIWEFDFHSVILKTYLWINNE